MNCPDCPRYDSVGEKCKDGKINPGSYQLASEAVQIFGIRSICTYNDFRETLLERRSVALDRKNGQQFRARKIRPNR